MPLYRSTATLEVVSHDPQHPLPGILSTDDEECPRQYAVGLKLYPMRDGDQWVGTRANGARVSEGDLLVVENGRAVRHVREKELMGYVMVEPVVVDVPVVKVLDVGNGDLVVDTTGVLGVPVIEPGESVVVDVVLATRHAPDHFITETASHTSEGPRVFDDAAPVLGPSDGNGGPVGTDLAEPSAPPTDAPKAGRRRRER